MSFSTPVTFVALQVLTAAQLNAMQTNISALWPYAAAGDIPYATASNNLSKLAIGAAGTYLKSTGTAPSWAALTTINAVDLLLLADRAVADATYSAIDWTSEVIDTNAMHSTVTNKSRVTIKETGWYHICFQAIWEVSNSGIRESLVKKNGTTTLWKVAEQVLAVARSCQIVSGLEYLVATDYITCEVWQNSGGAQDLLYSDGGYPEKYPYTRLTVLKVTL